MLIKILYVNGGLMDRGGISAVMMNYFFNFEQKKIKIDFLVHGFQKGAWDDEIIKRGGKIYRVPPKSQNLIGNIKGIEEVLKNNKYDIIHVHADAGNAHILRIAKQYKIPVRISHSHNTNYVTKNKIKILLGFFQKKAIKKYATNLWACSDEAAKWLYGNNSNYKVINNAIDTRKYVFDEACRKEIREKYNIGSSILFGNVGRLDYQKNHSFLIQWFYKYLQKNPNAKLMLVGDGHLRESLENKVQELQLQSKVIFIGQVCNPEYYYSAFDAFVMPSNFEGLGIVAVEAQCNGLKCFLSDVFPKGIDITKQVKTLPLNDVNSWVDEISKSDLARADSNKNTEVVISANYDIYTEAKKLEATYIDMFNNQMN